MSMAGTPKARARKAHIKAVAAARAAYNEAIAPAREAYAEAMRPHLKELQEAIDRADAAYFAATAKPNEKRLGEESAA